MVKNGRDYIKESYFVGGKMKFRRIYLIDGIPEEDFFKENASDIDRLINGEYWEISYEKDFINNSGESTKQKTDSSDNEIEDLPF
ncbi:hypothetical protein [Cyclobacterium salsum]|uniref:hypothetical protein n=1 Tax=Cyclobacterium salsum TaxID=2666329 RepID=UPI001391B165|nr:hypothetical protein [Cyclobacterium salsum]